MEGRSSRASHAGVAHGGLHSIALTTSVDRSASLTWTAPRAGRNETPLTLTHATLLCDPDPDSRKTGTKDRFGTQG